MMNENAQHLGGVRVSGGSELIGLYDRLVRPLVHRRGDHGGLSVPSRWIRLWLLVVTVVLLPMLAGCSRMSVQWKEEVRLSNGQLLVVDRTARGTIKRDIGMRVTGWKPKETTLRIPQASPDVRPPPVWRSVLIPIVLDYDPATSTWSVVATYLFCSTWYDVGKSASPYVQFISSQGQPWHSMPLQPGWAGRRANLLTHIRPVGEPHLVREADKEAPWKQVGERFQAISTTWKTHC